MGKDGEFLSFLEACCCDASPGRFWRRVIDCDATIPLFSRNEERFATIPQHNQQESSSRAHPPACHVEGQGVYGSCDACPKRP